MCGIAGIWRPGANADAAIARSMADTLRHRGPDDGGVWSDDEAGIALSHRRLSIIDLSPAGHQPMVSADDRYVISYNGEVYNFPDLRRELEGAGVGFRSDSDTEVLLEAISHWGLERAVERFVGMFAFALWDRRQRVLTLVRDRLGIKPLYWGRLGGAFVFASEPRAFTVLPGWTGAIDSAALDAYLRWNYVPAPRCIYAGLNKLKPGTILRLESDLEPRLEVFWDLRKIAVAGSASPLQLSDAEATDQLESLLGDAVGRRMVSDVPLGAFLSGGIDSSLVVALMQSRSARPVKTFTIGFDEQRFNEADHAEAVAQHLGTDHQSFILTPQEARDTIPALPGIYDEPFADSSQIPTFLVSRMTRDHVTVALSGDGGDELMAGYTRYRWADMTRRRFGHLPLLLRRTMSSGLAALPDGLWDGLGRVLPDRVAQGRLADRVGRFSAFLAQTDGDAIYRHQHTQWPEPPLAGSAAGAGQGPDPDLALPGEMPHFISRMQYHDSVQYMPDDILTKVDRASMAVSLEVRVPLIDHRLTEFSWRLPFAQKMRPSGGKWLLRQVLYRHVPAHLIDRPKSGFGVPVAQWLRGPLREWAEDLLSAENLQSDGLLNAQPIRYVWSRLQSGHDRFQEPIWGILMFQAWLRQQQTDQATKTSKISG